jgi:hypothetical protein
MKVYLGLLVLALAMVGVAAGLIIARPAGIDVPDELPIVWADSAYVMRGEREQLFIYNDGTVIGVVDRGLRPPGGSPTRKWSRGFINDKKGMLALMTGLQNEEFFGLADSYTYPGPSSSDLHYTLTVNLPDYGKWVRAIGFMSPDGGVTQPDMPHPLDDIYRSLRQIALETKEVATERIEN